MSMNSFKRTGKCLGNGAKGSVYLAFDEETGTFVAIKELNFHVTDDQEDNARDIMNEIKLLEKAQHENLIRYVGARRVGDKVEIAMEYVSGGSLSTVIRRQGSLRESVVRNYARDILKGLDYLHRVCKVCHRDIKPDNVLVTPEGRCKLADYGASRTIEKTTVMKTLIGTPYYMSPEVVHGEGYHQSADIWSLGICMYEMAVGKPPHSELTLPMAIMFRIANATAPPPMPSTMSPQLQELIGLCLERDASKRPTAEELLRHSWFAMSSSSLLQQSNAAVPPPVAQSTSLVMEPSAPPVTQDTTTTTTTTATTTTTGSSGPAGGGTAASEDFPFFDSHQEQPQQWYALCQECLTSPAMLTCDECRAAGVLHCNLCVMCWGVAHQHPRSVSHVKRPFVFEGAALPSNEPNKKSNNNNNNNNNNNRHHHHHGHGKGGGGLLLADGNFVDVCCVGEQSEWTCGRCNSLNDGPAPQCVSCGYER